MNMHDRPRLTRSAPGLAGRIVMFCVLLVLWLVLPPVAHGQSNTAREVPVMHVSGSSFALSVADLNASTQWYKEKLGLKVVMQVPRTSETKASVTLLQGGGLTVELVYHDESVTLRTLRPGVSDATSVQGIFKVGVVVDDFNKTFALLKERGVEVAFGPFPKRPDQPANAIIRDNSGNLIQISGK